MSILDDDLDAILSDPTFRVAVSHGGYETFGYESDSDSVPSGEPYEDVDAAGRTHSLLIRTGTLPGIAQGEDVEVMGKVNGYAVTTKWKIRRIHHEDDGRLQRLYLGKRVET